MFFRLQTAQLNAASINMTIQLLIFKPKKRFVFFAPIAGVIDAVIDKDIWSGKTNKGEARGGLAV